MKSKLVLLVAMIACFTAYSQADRSDKATESNQKAEEKRLIKVSIIYPFAEGKIFDMDYYETRHMPMVAGFLGSNLVKYTIEKGIASGIPDTPLPFMAIGSFYVKDLATYQAAIKPNRDTIRSDFPNYTNISPIILISEVIR